MMSTLDRLVYMANQIARNLAAQGEKAAVRATADHIASFWEPRMKEQIFRSIEERSGDFDPIARSAILMLRDKGAPPHQTAATRFNAVDEVGGSDAG